MPDNLRVFLINQLGSRLRPVVATLLIRQSGFIGGDVWECAEFVGVV